VTAAINVRPEDLARVLAQGEAARRDRVLKAMHEAALLGAELVARKAPVDTGALKGSVHYQFGGVARASVVVDAPHGAAVEVGSRPHWVPLQALIDWVKRHRAGLGIRGKVGRDERGRFAASAAIEQAARGLQAKIAREGTKPTWFVRDTLPTLRKALGTLIKRRLKDR
jgi:hypothetical protein